MTISQIEEYRNIASLKQRSIVGFIPARGGSKGIKNKNLIDIDGYPLIAHSILSLLAAGIKDVYVSTDSKTIGNVAIKYGAKYLHRPSDISQDESTTEEAILHFLSKVNCDIIAFRQCTSPLLNADTINNMINEFVAKDDLFDSMFTIYNTKELDMLLWKESLRPLNYDHRNRSMRQSGRINYYIETGGLYLFKRNRFLKEKCRICGRFSIFPISYEQSLEIDVPKDIERVKRFFIR
jgi:N-acylneuraminate cytidylyltransferase